MIYIKYKSKFKKMINAFCQGEYNGTKFSGNIKASNCQDFIQKSYDPKTYFLYRESYGHFAICDSTENSDGKLKMAKFLTKPFNSWVCNIKRNMERDEPLEIPFYQVFFMFLIFYFFMLSFL